LNETFFKTISPLLTNRADVGTIQLTDTPLHTMEGSFIGKFSADNLDLLFSNGN